MLELGFPLGLHGDDLLLEDIHQPIFVVDEADHLLLVLLHFHLQHIPHQEAGLLLGFLEDLLLESLDLQHREFLDVSEGVWRSLSLIIEGREDDLLLLRAYSRVVDRKRVVYLTHLLHELRLLSLVS